MKGTILIVEDNDRVCNSLYDWLSVIFPDYTLPIAKSGEEAIDHVTAKPPDIVLMDIGLPGMNGIRATQIIKAIAPQTKVVVVTIYEDLEHQTGALAAGASAYVTKRKMHNELIPIMSMLLGK
jgi:CheY-like chemotaxis protein